MSLRPWVTPEDVKEYTEDPSVKKRSDTRLGFDIARAESGIIQYCNNDFSSYESIPEDVKKAVILLSESYAVHSVRMKDGGMLSEDLDDYSYTRDSGYYSLSVSDLGLEGLLDAYKLSGNGTLNMTLWGL